MINKEKIGPLLPAANDRNKKNSISNKLFLLIAPLFIKNKMIKPTFIHLANTIGPPPRALILPVIVTSPANKPISESTKIKPKRILKKILTSLYLNVSTTIITRGTTINIKLIYFNQT